MGLLGMLSGKREVTTPVKNELDNLLNRWGKAIEKMNTVDTVSAYISALEDALLTAKKLEYLENTYDWKYGKYKWNGGVYHALAGLQNKKFLNERAFIDRAYEKLQRECLKVMTEAAKQRKRNQFFIELEHYNKYFEAETIAYINYLKSSV